MKRKEYREVGVNNVWFKILDNDRMPMHGGSGQYPEPGVWTEPVIPRLASKGYHLVRPREILSWLGPCIWLAEGRGERDESDGRIAYESVRLLREGFATRTRSRV